MIKKLAQSLREYKKPTILTLIFITGEVFFEVLIPFFTADLVNAIKAFSAAGQEAAGLHDVVKQGLLLVAMALASLGCGSVAAITCAKASSGYAKNLRHDMFARIQSFSFENIDRFSSASLVTRMTTDISNVQMTFMMLIRMAVRSPLMFLFAVIMSFIMGGKLSLTFVIVIPVLVFGLLLIAKKAMPAFRAVFKKYDRLNESIEENVRAMRVVKGFAREDYEKDKFGHASRGICKDFTYAERVVALNNPLMQLCIYFNMIFILTVGSKLIITSGGTLIDVGQISAMLTYGSGDSDVPYLLLQTIAIAVLGTLFGAILAIPFAFLASFNIMPKPVAYVVRVLILMIRTIPSIVWALMWIRVTGPGAACGVITQSVCSIGMISKMYITAIEDLDTHILESLDAMGCTPFQKIRYGVIPQLTASFISTTIYRFDINLKDATTLGIVGAGGIGASLVQCLNSRRWAMVGSFVWGLMVLVLIIEFIIFFSLRRAT